MILASGGQEGLAWGIFFISTFFIHQIHIMEAMSYSYNQTFGLMHANALLMQYHYFY